MLKRDAKSQEDFVVRGILDGYLAEDKIVLLTTRQTDTITLSQLIERYRSQLSLYAALSRSYQIDKVEKYLKFCLT